MRRSGELKVTTREKNKTGRDKGDREKNKAGREREKESDRKDRKQVERCAASGASQPERYSRVTLG